MNSRNLIIGMVGATAVCLMVMALVLIVSVIIITSRSSAQSIAIPVWQDPAQIGKLKIDPPLSIAALASGDVLAINAMLSRGELDSALLTAVYASTLSDRQRLAVLQLVGERYGAAENAAGARQTYQVVIDLVALSPALSDFERTEALAQAASALYSAKERNMAGLAINAGRDIALQSPFLKDANRFTLLGKLLLSAQHGDDGPHIKLLNEDRANFVNLTDPNPVALTEPPDPLPAIEAAPKDAKLAAAQAKRIAAAKEIAKLSTTGSTVPDDLIADLAEALFEEDDQYVRIAALPTNQMTLAQKAALIRAQIDWLTTKMRVARKAFGISIIGEWEDSENEISSELAKTYETLYTLRTEQSVGMPKQNDIELAQSYLQRRLLVAGRLGNYPNFPENTLVDDLNSLTETLIGTQPNSSLRVKAEEKDGRYYYHLVDDDNWFGPVETPTPAPRTTRSPTRRPSATPVRTSPAGGPTTSGPQPQATPSRAAGVTSAPAAATNTAAPSRPAATNLPPPTNTPQPVPPTSTPRPAPTNTPQPPPPTATRAAYP